MSCRQSARRCSWGRTRRGCSTGSACLSCFGRSQDAPTRSICCAGTTAPCCSTHRTATALRSTSARRSSTSTAPTCTRGWSPPLPAGALRLGARVTGIDQGRDGVTVAIESGESVTVEAVVVADGIRSHLRQQLVGPEDPLFSGTVVYRGVISRAEALDLHPDGVNRYWLGPYRHGVSYWIAAGRLLALNLGVQRANPSTESWTLTVDAAEAIDQLDG